MPPAVPAVVCTGFDITPALQHYFQVGHKIDVVQLLNEALAGEEDDLDLYDNDADKNLYALDRETALVLSLQEHLRRVREDAPVEDREVLEIPYSYEKRFPDNYHTRLFVPTGAYARELDKSGALATPPEEDVKAIKSFIECANRLLPDDAARERAGLKLEDLQYTIRYPRELRFPFYLETRRENRLPPRPVREFLKSVSSGQ
ncbi:hypothetical protein OH76DRAFT_1348274 [Lentinus brumalis]|uniref:Uncharacterized protein n=1 Tax=Lentinus brumalis TaxID=2498619 RepID=A0A371DE02_9APHY|nr:hypothetical protein OH76DRAFT_1348274 [Polyporus brumalis]